MKAEFLLVISISRNIEPFLYCIQTSSKKAIAKTTILFTAIPFIYRENSDTH